MSLRVANITLDCVDTMRVASFWAGALGRRIDAGAGEWFASIGRDDATQPAWYFIKVSEPKVVKNRMHIDLRADDCEAELRRLVTLGATRLSEQEQYGYRWTTAKDVEGNEFCVS